MLPFLHPIADLLQSHESNPARLAADFHTAFNILLALMFIGPLDIIAAQLMRWLPDQPRAADPGTPVYLDPSAASAPAVALVCAAREVLRMGDLIETMLRQAMTALLRNNRKLVADISRMDDAIDKNLMDLASKKIRRGITFSKQGKADLVEFHQLAVDSLKLSVGIFMSGVLERAGALQRSRLKDPRFGRRKAALGRLPDKPLLP